MNAPHRPAGNVLVTPEEAFVTRLRRCRQWRRISLDEIAAQTRINRALLEALEANDLRAWPGGLYQRAWIRAYAGAVGVSPDETVDEFCRLFPLADRRNQTTVTRLAAIMAIESSCRDDYDPVAERRAGACAGDTIARRWAWGQAAAPLRVAGRAWSLLADGARGLRVFSYSLLIGMMRATGRLKDSTAASPGAHALRALPVSATGRSWRWSGRLAPRNHGSACDWRRNAVRH